MPSEAHSKTRVLVVDDHQMFIQGIVAMFSEDEDIDILDGCADGQAVLEQLKSVMADVILLDINLPDMDGVDVCKKISALYPSIKIIALTMYNEGSFITGMLKNGAKGYVLKNSDKSTLKEAIKTVHEGGSFFGEDVTKTLMQGMMPKKQTSKFGNLPKLTRREKEILKLIVQEHTTQEISEQLFISLNTVETHRKNLLQKLNVRNTAGLVRFAIENRLVD
jgi:DNA-binding NarL/FixJ family response regulator